MQGYLLFVATIALVSFTAYPRLSQPDTKNQVADAGGAIQGISASCIDQYFACNDTSSGDCDKKYDICTGVTESCTPTSCPAIDLNNADSPTGGPNANSPTGDGNVNSPPGRVGGSPGRTAIIHLENPLEAKSVEDLIVSVVKTLLKLAIPVAILFIIWSGFQFVMAQGNPEKIKKAIQTFQWTVIGLAVILGSYVIATIIKTTIESLG